MARQRAIIAVPQSPARADAPEPDAWIPILDLGLLERLEAQIDPALARELAQLDLRELEPAPRPSAPRRALVLPAPVVPAEREQSPAPPAPELLGDPLPVPARVVRPPDAPPAPHRHHRAGHWLILAAALAVVAAGVPYFLRSPVQRRVTVDVDGLSFTRMTGVADVGGLLATAGVVVAPGDRVTPGPSASLRDGATVRVLRAFPLTVDVDGRVRSIRTTATNVKALRRELRIPKRLVAVDPPGRLRADGSVVFRTPSDLTLVIDGVAGSLTSTARTVGGLLAERGIAFAPGDQVDPPLDAPLRSGLAVTITHTTAGRVTEDVAVPFEVHEQADPSLPEGQRRTVQSGSDGVDRTTYQLTRAGDAVVARQPMGTVRVTDPRPEIVAVGTQPVGGAARQSGVATWYATLHQPGTCAHLHIPFGTLVRVVDTETGAVATCRVADRGPEAWTGNIIDLSPDVFEQLRPLSTGEAPVRLEY